MIEIKSHIDNSIILTTEVLDTSYRNRTLMNENSLTLYFNRTEFIEVPIGSYCIFQGEKYILMKPQNFKKNNWRNFEFTLIMDSVQGVMKNYKFRDKVSKRLKFSNTARPQEHLEMLVWNLNQPIS